MPIDYAKLKSWPVPDIEHRYEVKDTILYALGLGCGSDPVDEDDLRFVYEDNIRVQPAMAVILGYPGFWIREPETGIDWTKVLAGEQGLVLHNRRRAGDGDWPGADHRDHRQGYGQRGAAFFGAGRHRQGDRRPSRDTHLNH